ncbi:MAG: kinase/pyrophosphorylase [Holophagaceae bacterium]|uniref:Putative pyruvate, phosphate dikinase regulatory protein n=1 Tax=Candidatus Geothrix skivensis TaxID=2954439 RepID=A0A9D7XHY4_9BACT|nr:kinase/pyrophosphorylase [Candidatus Geothrix skivensis]
MDRQPIYVVSGGSGETAHRMVEAALTQFAKGETSALVRRFQNVRTLEDLDRVLQMATEKRAVIIHTTVSREMRDYIDRRCAELRLTQVDLFGNLLDTLAIYLRERPEERPGSFHAVGDKYFRRIDAIEYALKFDDGIDMAGLIGADIVLVGISRTSKTPLSMYLAMEGFKVMNVPLVPGVALPPELETIPQGRIVGLTIQADRLQEIRAYRLKRLGATGSADSYSDMGRILEELQYADDIFKRHRRWPVLDVTGRSIEETAGLVLDRVFGKERAV